MRRTFTFCCCRWLMACMREANPWSALLLRLRESFFNVVAGPAGLQRESAKLRGQAKRWAVTAVMACCEAMGLLVANGPLCLCWWLPSSATRPPPCVRLGFELMPKRPNPGRAKPHRDSEGTTMSSKAKPIGIEKQGEKSNPYPV